MIEAHVVTARNARLYENEYDEFLRKRHDYFVTQKRWRPESPEGRETDQFDTDAATYVLGMEDGELVTSARLIPTSEPHLVSEVFPHYCDGGVPRRPDWAEWTRTFVLPRKRATGLRGTLTQLCCAVMEFALEEGLQAVGGIQETYFMPHHGAIGWVARPLGLAQQAANGEFYIVAYIDVDERALANVRRVLRIDHGLLVRRGEQRPFMSRRAPEVTP